MFDIEKDSKKGNGFTYTEFSSKDMLKNINRALKFYKTKPEEWKELVKRAMNIDNSWDKSAKKYLELYNILMKK